MAKSIYTYYKERLIEIGGNNKCLYLKNVNKKSAYDLGKIFEARDDKVSEFVKFLWSDGKYPLTVIGTEEKTAILQNLNVQTKLEAKEQKEPLVGEDAEKYERKLEKARYIASQNAIEAEITKLKNLKREVEEIEKETGRYELYVGYPFVFGTLMQGFTKTIVKAPLLLFPVKINIPNDNTVEITLNGAEKVHINPALVFAYAQSKRISVDGLELEFDDISEFSRGVDDVISYLSAAHIKIDGEVSKNTYDYSRFKEPSERDLSLRNAAILGRFPLSNSIYTDYTLLEKKKLTNNAVNELLKIKKAKEKKKKKKASENKEIYNIKMLDYAQTSVIEKVNENGNMVIYGPPGTGKSQTIVNIISDALAKNKRVLVVSQKKAALDVVYNRLGSLSSKAMYVSDEGKEKRDFYDKCLRAHHNEMNRGVISTRIFELEHTELEKRIDAEVGTLNSIYSTLNQKRPFGLSLSEMYSSSYMLSKTSPEYDVYTRLTKEQSIMALSYKELRDAIFNIKAENFQKLYYDFVVSKEKNPMIDHMQQDLDITTLSEVKTELQEIQKCKKGYFSTTKHPYYRQVMAYYKEIENEETLNSIVKQECSIRFAKKSEAKKAFSSVKESFVETKRAIESFVEEYACLQRVLSYDGYISVIDNITRGNSAYLKHVYDAIENYISARDITNLLNSLDTHNIAILNFAYSVSKNYQGYVNTIDKIMELRIYHEIIRYEEECKDELSRTVDYANITSRIYKLKEEQLASAERIAEARNGADYEKAFNTSKVKSDYFHQISKKQKFWPIRKTMEYYGDLILTLFPCWLLSPENVSCLLPLEKNLFDLVIFDEASQVFIENTIPAIYRGKNIVVAGDSKQLRPSTTFMKRYLGGDLEYQDDPTVQAALEVESLLDLAVSRYHNSNLTYHYRSRNSELINFSNKAFYADELQVVPNVKRNVSEPPIERIKVSGKWIERKNTAEAKKIVELLTEIFATRKNNESIGIITFNSDQQSCISDFIDKEIIKNPDFRAQMMKESHRVENGEDTSIFVKNLENVQGDERDIIIFSTGYAPNEEGKIYTSFGSLSMEGGENRLNVAITRAKSKIIIVTSVEPEQLRIDSAKNLGPRLLKKYLMYARAVSQGDGAEIGTILSEVNTGVYNTREKIATTIPSVSERIKERLEKLGYTVDSNLGSKNTSLSLAIYDSESDKYLVGIEIDTDAFESSMSPLERDVYKPKFFEARGWPIIRVWSRDWWLYPQKVIKAITNAAEKNKK